MEVINNMVKRILCLTASLLLFTSCGSVEKSNEATETVTSSVSITEENFKWLFDIRQKSF